MKKSVIISSLFALAIGAQASILTDPSFETGKGTASIYKFTNDAGNIALTSADLDMWVSREASSFATKFETTDIGTGNAEGYTVVSGQTGSNSALLRSKDKRGMVQVVAVNVLIGQEVQFSGDFALVGLAGDVDANVQVVGFNDFTALTVDLGGNWKFTGGTYDVLFDSALAKATYAGTTYKSFSNSATVTADYAYLGVVIGGDGGADNSLTSFVAFDDVQLTVIPEPATLGLIAMVGTGLIFVRRTFMI